MFDQGLTSPDRRYQIFLKSGGGNIDVYLVSRHDEEPSSGGQAGSSAGASAGSAGGAGAAASGSTPSDAGNGVADMDATDTNSSTRQRSGTGASGAGSTSHQDANAQAASAMNVNSVFNSPAVGPSVGYGPNSQDSLNLIPPLSAAAGSSGGGGISSHSASPGMPFTPVRQAMPLASPLSASVSVVKVAPAEDTGYYYQLNPDEGLSDLFGAGPAGSTGGNNNSS